MNPALPGARTAAAYQGIHEGGLQTDTFFIGRDGGLYVAWIVGTGAWNAPFRITPDNMAPQGCAVAAAGRSMVPFAQDPSGESGEGAFGIQGELDVLFMGNRGGLHVSSVIGLGTWNPPADIGPGNIAPAGADVAVAHQLPNQLNAFFVGNDGGIYVAWIVDGPGNWWNGPLRITPPGVAPPGGRIIAAKQTHDQLNVFFVANDGRLNVSWVTGIGSWQGPIAITPSVAPPGAALTAAQQTSQQLNVFFVDNDGKLNVSWVVGVGAWQGPIAITPSIATPGAGVAAAMQTTNQLDAFVVDRDGRLCVSWVVGVGAWAGPVGVTEPGHAPPGSTPVTWYQSNEQLDVFVNGNERWVSWVSTGGGNWNGPYGLPS
ncbi:hypothetical protein [Nonomuraea sp. NPDC049758]|uniref:hypothetical protein n=1 Tax=Nonomuraea sp. NPDC049758 TaxID=3154360 RepID=UPI003430C893